MMSEGEISDILAFHLVSQLVGQSPSAYMVSNDTITEGRTRFCPCGCLTEITYGNTNFGTKELWYGRPDIMAFPYCGGSVNVVLQLDDDEKKSMIEIKFISSSLDAIDQIQM